MEVKFKPISVIETKLGIQENGPAHSFFTQTCYKKMSKFVPGGESSMLNQNVVLASDSITYASPSAHYMYVGKVMGPNIPIEKEGNMVTKWISPKGKQKHYTGTDIKYSVPGTGGQWDKRMWTSEGKEVLNEVQQYIDGGCKQ